MKFQRAIPLLAATLLLAATHASDFTIGWSPSPSPGITNYVIYAHTNALTSTNLNQAVFRANVGTALQLRFTNIVPGRWHFTGTAMRDGVESGPAVPLTIEVPAPPAAMRIVILQYSTTLSASTNWQDAGFFKIRIE